MTRAFSSGPNLIQVMRFVYPLSNGVAETVVVRTPLPGTDVVCTAGRGPQTESSFLMVPVADEPLSVAFRGSESTTVNDSSGSVRRSPLTTTETDRLVTPGLKVPLPRSGSPGS